MLLASLVAVTFLSVLLSRRRCIITRTVLGHTPLHAAAMSGCPLSASLLVDAGANIGQRTQYGETPLLSACRCRGESGASTLRVLLEALRKELKPEQDPAKVLDAMINTKKRRAIDIAARSDSAATLRILLAVGVDTKAYRFTGGKARNYASARGQKSGPGRWGSDFDFRTSLLEKAAIKLSPLSLAAERGNGSCVRLLLGAGADANERSGQNVETALMCAVRRVRPR